MCVMASVAGESIDSWVDIVHYFFFQAEDGIRDLTVTGVQTCALPILRDHCLTGDLNRDAKTDMWCETSSGSGMWSVALSTGNGWSMSTLSGPATSTPISDRKSVV